MLSLDYCRQKVQSSQQAAIIRFPFLATSQRHALLALHAYTVELNNIVANPSDINIALTALKWWEEQIANLYQTNATPSHPVLQLLQSAIEIFKLPQAELLVLLQVATQTLTQPRFNHMHELMHHAQQAGYLTGRLSSRILGFQADDTLDFADAAGQLCHLCYLLTRIGADARNGLIYIPMSKLKAFKVPVHMILNQQGGAEFNQLMLYFIGKLQQQHQKVSGMLNAIDKHRQRASLAQLACTYTLIKEISRDGVGNVLNYQLNIPRPRQFRLALKTALIGFRFN